ncbi:hypothetical protein F4778DRAFT_757967 [Xylariomycetidae sp. FL2044]|nr:hypothetical protein F4778DRAFT_757967 [Xylariomycetidae sp. FL2044]
MSFKVAFIASAALLNSFVLASPLLLPRLESDCPQDTNFYVCSNGYRGCYSTDPCALPALTSPTIAAATAAPTPDACQASTPTSTAAPTATCPSGSEATARVRPSKMYNLYPQDASKAEAPVNAIDQQRTANVSQLEQAVVFAGLPQGAKSCSLGWSQGAAGERDFQTKGSGLISTLQLAGLPSGDGDVSFGTVAPFVDGARAAGTPVQRLDMTFWDDASYPAQDHTVGFVDCAESMYFRLAVDDSVADGFVHMAQDEQNGLFISYMC